eukprot:gene16212-biopygen18770
MGDFRSDISAAIIPAITPDITPEVIHHHTPTATRGKTRQKRRMAVVPRTLVRRTPSPRDAGERAGSNGRVCVCSLQSLVAPEGRAVRTRRLPFLPLIAPLPKGRGK